ncbi:serine hydrolase domain-containing protein [Hyphobacterium marinum]|uniref:Serine hydrolase domain-containing protein n=1 Tax=Hyphobacterium marinum TaxID=3116574 RepID=A0ABU7LZC5_9PROT|nr:serine hydrolase domain-containing protein [Hyphobacterium sp. Y6023]MEE2566806.1 serine hydrolase domain-containing protein [Hyphobacterium sp. Y6023]
MITTLPRLLALLLLFSPPATALAQVPPGEAANAIMVEVMAETPVPAFSGAVWADGDIAWAQAFGTDNIETGTPARTSHRFRLGSVSKVVTATLAARLADDGVIDLDAPISTWMPDLPEHHRATTLRQLLGHQGGVRHYGRADFDPTAPGGIIDRRFYPDSASALALFIEDPLVNEPGTAYAYTTFGYTLAAAVMEAATGEDFLSLVEAQITVPLGLDTLGPDRPLQVTPNRVGFYDPIDFVQQRIDATVTGEVANALDINPAYKWAGGGFIATPSDLVRFGAGVLGDGFLSEATRTDMFTNQTLADGEETLVGLGWRIDTDATGRVRYHHAGMQEGARAVLVVYPEHGVAVALMSNLGGTPQDILGYATRIAEGYLD